MVRNKLVYAFLREDDTPFYIGMGSLERCCDHSEGSRNRRWWEEMKANPKYKFTIIDCDLSKQEAWDIEVEHIKKFGRQYIDDGGILTNIHPGGSFWGEASTKVVRQYTIDGKFIRKFDTANKAGEWLENNTKAKYGQGNISSCCLYKKKSIENYQWFYESEVGDIDYIGPVKRMEVRNKNHDARAQCMIDLNTLEVFKSKNSLARSLGYKTSFPTGGIDYSIFKPITKEEYYYLNKLKQL